MSFSIYESYVALCDNERVIIYDINNDTENVMLLPELESNKKIDIHNNIDTDNYHMITSIMFSEDGEYLAVCINRKQLCVYKTKNLKLLSNQALTRAASRMRFIPNNDIVIADKTGDVYLFPISSSSENGTLILGHLSMLLDVLITHDMKYILTTDRDEKIRISMFPNCYNILCYCLGHVKFVTNISELSHNKSILISCGGDGVLKLWDYRHGTELMSINFHDKISKYDIEEFNKNLRNFHYEEHVDIIPVKHLRVSCLSEIESLIVISFYSSKVLLIYSITNCNGTQLKTNYLESINVGVETIDCFLHKQDLWILAKVGLQVYKFVDNRFVIHNSLNYAIERLNKFWKTLNNLNIKQDLYPVLYKRKYDNVQEYLEKKKCRLANVME